MFNTDIKIAYFGTSEFSVFVLEELRKLGITPDIIVTTPDKPQGRKLILTPTPTKVWAENNSIEYAEPEKLKDESFVNKMKEYDLFIVASYGKIIPEVVINIPQYKVINIHPSMLPKYRGPSPLQEQILHDEKEIGVSIMLIDKEVDHGDIIVQKKIDIANWPIGFQELSKILAKVGAQILAEALPSYIKGKIVARAQKHSEATFTKKVEKIDGFIDLSADPYKNYLKILAYEEWPGTFFEAEKNSKKIRVLIKKAIFQDHELKILRVLPEGKKEMNYQDFLRGLK